MNDYFCPQSHCGAALQREDRYCVRCGSPTGHIKWKFSSDNPPTDSPVRISPGGKFFLLAHNVGLHSARVALDTRNPSGAILESGVTARVSPGQAAAFPFHHIEGQKFGEIIVRSQDAPRPRDQWWEREAWRVTTLRLLDHIQIQQERWVWGCPAILFPPGVRKQWIRVWNDAEAARPLLRDLPRCFSIRNLGKEINAPSEPVSPGLSVKLVVEALPPSPYELPDSEWLPEADGKAVPLIRMVEGRSTSGPDVVIAIDFGTRNTGIRVRWRHAVPSKPAGTVDFVGDTEGNARFPTAMVLHRREKTFFWGSKAAERIENNLLQAPDEVAVTNLKTYMRENVEAFVEFRKDWTNEEIAGRYFEKLFESIDQYFRALNLDRRDLNARYILTRPVLDANEGDAKGSLYELALQIALTTRCGVEAHQIHFIQEPAAAAMGIARQRREELLELQGKAVAVVDAGGGTTDVALATVRVTDGQLSLDVSASFSLRLDSEWAKTLAHKAIDYFQADDRAEFGGNVLDYALAYQLLHDAPALLETDGRPIPPHLRPAISDAQGNITAQARSEFLTDCRTMKERFAHYQTQYLNRSAAAREPDEVYPFATRAEYEGVYMDHALLEESLLNPILSPCVENLQETMFHAAQKNKGILPAQVRKVFYVGGTNIDYYVRSHFASAFLGAGREADREPQIQERLNMVVEGAVWSDEKMFVTCPLTLRLYFQDQEREIAKEGDPLSAHQRVMDKLINTEIARNATADIRLEASGGGLPAPVVVAAGFYRNEGNEEDFKPLQLRYRVSYDKGVVATLTAGGRNIDQLDFALTGSA